MTSAPSPSDWGGDRILVKLIWFSNDIFQVRNDVFRRWCSHLFLGCSRLCKYMKLTSSRLISFDLKARVTQLMWVLLAHASLHRDARTLYGMVSRSMPSALYYTVRCGLLIPSLILYDILGLYLSSFSKCHFSLKCWEFIKCTPTFKLKYKSKLSNFLKLKNHSYSPSYLRQLERSLKWLGACQQGLVMALMRRRRGRMLLKCVATST